MVIRGLDLGLYTQVYTKKAKVHSKKVIHNHMTHTQSPKLNMTVILAALIIAGGMVFLGLSLRTSGGSAGLTAEEFEKQLRAYQQKQQEAQQQDQAQRERERLARAKNVAPITPEDHVRGKANAPITLYEYSDFECPYCKKFAQVPPTILKNNPDTVNVVYRHFPLSFHDPLATQEAIAAECAAKQGGTDAFYAYHDAVFAKTRSNGKGLDVAELPKIAGTLGLNVPQFTTCLASGEFDEHIKQDIKSGSDAGVTGTPGVIVKNNKTGDVRVIPGAVPAEVVQGAIDELLQQ